MDKNIALHDFLKEILEPIIDDCIRRSMMKYLDCVSQEPQVDPGALNITEAAKLLKLAVPTIYGLAQKRKIPYYKRAKRLYFRKNDLEVWINKGRVKTQDEIDTEVNTYIVRRKGKRDSY